MGLLDFLLGNERRARAARRAELAGDLPRAVELFLEAGRRDDAARVLLLRVDAELSPQTRLILLGRAIDVAPKESAVGIEARRRRALLIVELAKSGAIAAALRHDVRAAGEELLSLGDAAATAVAFGLADDEDGRARALVAAGAVDELEELLGKDADAARRSLDRQGDEARVLSLVASGERREALRLAEALAGNEPVDSDAADRARALAARRLLGPTVRVTVGETPARKLVLGDSVRVGRNEGEILIAHAAVSRVHLTLFRRDGVAFVKDSGSRNGTTFRGARLGGELAIHERIDLMLGGEVPLAVSSSTRSDAPAVILEIAGEVYEAPLGPFRVGIGDWALEVDSDRWLVLKRGETPAYFGEVALGAATELLAGDGVAEHRGEKPSLRVDRA